MSGKRIGALVALVLGVGCTVGAAQAGAAGGKTVLRFHDTPGTFTGVGFNANDPNAIPPIGAQFVIKLSLQNVGTQFGKPTGTTVGRVLLDCTVLALGAQSPDGVCSGIAHVPNGYFTFGGNGAFNNNTINRYDITGGVGPYANDRGEIRVVNHADNSSDATVTLLS